METNPNEPTLTCSEVVERLQECFHHPIGKFDRAWFDWTMAEKILAEWRERRVQELEEALRECFQVMLLMRCNADLREPATKADAVRMGKAMKLANDALEWREQIRKGAKHESDL